MNSHPYHHYLLFDVANGFYRLDAKEQDKRKQEFAAALAGDADFLVTAYATRGLKAQTAFLLWCRATAPELVQAFLGKLFRTALGEHLLLTQTYFGLARESEYSGRAGKTDQMMETYADRLPYFVLYPFTKTNEWHALDFEARKAIMGEHVKVGIGHPKIRQCLLYSYGLDDQEFLVSYEMHTLQEFQDLVMAMRHTTGRTYTLLDTPTFTGIYQTPAELMSRL